MTSDKNPRTIDESGGGVSRERSVDFFRRLLPGGWLAIVVAAVVACESSSSRPEEATQDGATQADAVVLPKGATRAADRITAEGLRDDITELSSNRFEGRGPGSDGDRRARGWLAGRLSEIGFAPGAPDGTYEQPFPIVGVTASMPDRWSFRAPSGDAIDFAWWDEYIAASGVQQASVSVEDAEVVFVGYGIEAPEEDWDDFAGVDLRGKVLLMLNNDPNWSPDLFGGERRLYYGRWTYKYESAARQGAAGAIIIHTRASAGYPWGVVQTSWDGEQFELPAGDEARTKIHGWLTHDAASRLVALSGRDLADLERQARRREFSPIPLGVTTSFAFENRLSRTETANVIGVLPGRERPDEAVVYSAHHDHLGIGKADSEGGDRIYNGALDNAAGCAQALAVAEALAALPEPPRRSSVFVFVGAEEQGLLGSKHFTREPTFPTGRIAANVNFELGNIWGPTRDVAIFGQGKSTLEDRLAVLATRQGRRIGEETGPDQGWYYRSDQFSFARVGVPAIWFKSGADFIDQPADYGARVVDAWIDQHYHQPSDEIRDDWNLDGMVEDARLAFWLGASVAETPTAPRWRPGDEFADEREAALRALGE